jgi:hypothetical protein
MLCWILIVGGLLIMMGQHDRAEALFYYFRLEDQVPKTHLESEYRRVDSGTRASHLKSFCRKQCPHAGH